MSETSTNLGLPYLQAAQAQKHLTHNEALERLDMIVQLSVQGFGVTNPPLSPVEGQVWALGAGAVGDWSGQDGDLAAWANGGWLFVTPREGWRAALGTELRVFDGSDWEMPDLPTLQNLPGVGIGTSFDGTNRLAVASDAVLFTHAGDDMQAKLNKAAPGDTASLLIQTGFSGRAEMGTLGSDDFAIKVSADGSAWTTALTIDAGTGLASGAAVQSEADDATAGRLLRVGAQVSVLGGVSAFAATLLDDAHPAAARATLGLATRPNVVQRNYVTQAAWLPSTSAADNQWHGVCWSAELGLFCAVAATGTGDRVMTSPDGITWTSRASASDNNWRSVCWSPELRLFCAVANTGTGDRVMTSPDGITWTARTSAADISWRQVVWSAELGLFCAAALTGTGNRVMTSPDGITWTSRASAADNLWYGLCWSPELRLFCAVATAGTGDRVMTSPDGITWTIRTSAADNQWYGVCWSAELGLFCAVATTGTGDRVMTSPDGITWTIRTSASDNNWRSVCWSAELGLFCAVATNGTGDRVMTSPHGITWTARTSAADNQWYGVCWSAELGLFCAVAATGTGDRVMTSLSAHTFPYRS